MFYVRRFLIALGALVSAAYCLWSMSHSPFLTPDSSGYIEFSPVRTFGYPVYLNISGVSIAVSLQPVLYVLALFFLCREIYAISRNIFLTFIFFLLCIVNPEVNKYSFFVLTEFLFMTLSMVALTFLLRFLRLPSLRAAAFASLFVALASIVRPTGYAFIPVLLLAVLFRWRVIRGRRFVLAAASLLPALLLSTAERIGAQAYHGAANTSLFGRHIYAKAGIIEAPSASHSQDARLRALETALENDFAPIRRVLAEKFPQWDVSEVISIAYEGCLQYACADSLRASLKLPEPAINTLAMNAGLSRIARAPEAFAWLALEHYRSLWTMYKENHPESVPILKAFLDEHPDLPYEPYIRPILAEHLKPPSLLAWFIRPTMIAIGGFTLFLGAFGLAGAFFRNLDTSLAGASLASFAVHSSFVFTALIGLGIPRYTMSLWPIMMASLVLAATWAIALIEKRALPVRYCSLITEVRSNA